MRLAVWQASKNARDDGLFSNEWEYASPGFITLSGQMNQVIGSTPLDYTAKTPLATMIVSAKGCFVETCRTRTTGLEGHS